MGKFISSINDLTQKGNSPKNPDLYAPKWSKELQDGKYVAYIRLLPNMITRGEAITAKEVCYLREPNDRNGKVRPIDNPNTIGKRDNPITQLYWDLRNTKDPEKEKLANDCLGGSKNYYAFIQVISDHNVNGELDLKVMLWRFGKKMYDRILNESNDSDVINLWSTNVLKLVVTQQGGNNNYDLSKFVDAEKLDIPKTYCFEKDGQYYQVSDDMTDEEWDQVQEQLADIQSNINHDDMEYHPWTLEDEDYVNGLCERVRMYAYPELMAGRQVFGGVMPQVPASAPAAQVVSHVQPTVAAAPVAPVAVAPVAQATPPAASRPVAPVAASAPKAPVISKPSASVAKAAETAGYSDDDLENLLGDE